MTEREAIVAWLREIVVAPNPKLDRPIWRVLLWGFFHPFQLGAIYGSLKFAAAAATIIERGDHIKETDNAQ